MSPAPWDILAAGAKSLALLEENPPQDAHEYGTLWLGVIIVAARAQAPEVAAYGVNCPDCWARVLQPCKDRRNGAAGQVTGHPHRNRTRKARRRGLIAGRVAA